MPKQPKLKPPKVTYKQEYGDDGYCYQVRVDGRAHGYADLTRSQAVAVKKRLLDAWAAAHPPKPVGAEPLTKAEMTALAERYAPCVYNTWQTIASDLEAACAECEERLTNAGAVEACMDPCYMGQYGGTGAKALSAEVLALIKAGRLDLNKLDRMVRARCGLV